MKLRKLGALAGAALFAFTACGTTGGGGVSGEIEIWSSLPRQGSNKAQTDTMVNAINMAIEARGGKIGALTIKYTDKDDSTAAKGAWDEQTEIKNANDAVANDRLVAYIGTLNSGAAKLSIPILCAKSIVMVSPANTYPGLTTDEGAEEGEPAKYYPNGCARNYTRVIPNDNLQGNAGALWASQLGAKSAYVLDDTELYGKGIANVFKEKAPDYGIEVVGEDGIDRTAPNYQALAEKVKAADPDIVYFGGITQSNAGQLWRDLREAMPDVMLMGPDGIFESEWIQAAGAAAEGTYITFGGVGPNQLTGAGADFVKEYNAKYPNNPAEAYTAYSYEAANVVLDAIDRAVKRTPKDMNELRSFVREEVLKTANYAGVLGTWSFDANGDTSLTEMTGQIVKDGEFVYELNIK